MFTLVVILIVGVIATGIWAYEKYLKAQIVAKAIDGQPGIDRIISEQTKALIEIIKKPEIIQNYGSHLRLPDGEYLGKTKDFDTFKNRSRLTYEPTPLEWKVLHGVVNKIYEV